MVDTGDSFNPLPLFYMFDAFLQTRYKWHGKYLTTFPPFFGSILNPGKRYKKEYPVELKVHWHSYDF